MHQIGELPYGAKAQEADKERLAYVADKDLALR